MSGMVDNRSKETIPSAGGNISWCKINIKKHFFTCLFCHKTMSIFQNYGKTRSLHKKIA